MSNTSGLEPVEYKVLIKPAIVEEKSKGGIILPEQVRDREKYAMQEGLLVAVGETAFTNPDWLRHPKVGETVYFDRYSGGLVKGADGEEYRLVQDKEIAAIITR